MTCRCSICKSEFPAWYKKPFKNNKAISTKSKRQTARERIFERDGFKCVVCGTTKNLTIDHKLPKSLGGTNGAYNLQTMCHDHNTEKGDNYPYYKHEVEEVDKWNTELMNRLKTI